MRPDSRTQACASMRSTARLFRLSMEAQASESLVGVVDTLSALLGDPSFPDAAAIDTVLAQVVRAQQNGDAIRLADLLEFELAPLLERSSIGG